MSEIKDNKYIEVLEEKIRDKEHEIESDMKKATNGIWGGIIFTMLFFGLAYACFNRKNMFIFNIIFYTFITFGLICLAVVASSYHDMKVVRLRGVEIDGFKEELELEQIPNQNIIVRADKQFKINQKELQRYYDLNVSQTKFLSKLGIFLIIFGLFIISTSVFLYLQISNDLWLLVSGTISGLLIDFIGAIFIGMYIKNLEASIEFHSKLANSNKLLLANSIATKISNEQLRETTLSEIAKGMIFERKD
jgi:hypothetical protein